MLRATAPRRILPTSAANKSIKTFVEPAFLLGRRPRIPGGAWPVEFLEKKSFADLQQLWFVLLKEKNMLATMKRHYDLHQEEMGAMPAPSRIKYVDESMRNLKAVMRARDERATAEALRIFNERVAKGVYRYPPGPQPPPGTDDDSATVVLLLSKHVPEERIRELFGRFDVFDQHKGIAAIKVELTQEGLDAKRAAEESFNEWRFRVDDARNYARAANHNEVSVFDDCQVVELAPGEYLEEPVIAKDVPVPPPKQPEPTPADPLARLKHAERSWAERQVLQLGYFPNITSEAQPATEAELLANRPTHPDEIDGPWRVTLVYDKADGGEYAKSLNITRIDDADVVGEIAVDTTPRPYATNCPLYREALGVDEADRKHQMEWPFVEKWNDRYYDLAVKPLHDIARHNWQNSAEYMEREALFTGESVWGDPIPIDPSCGDYVHIPPHAEPPKKHLPDAMEERDY